MNPFNISHLEPEAIRRQGLVPENSPLGFALGSETDLVNPVPMEFVETFSPQRKVECTAF